MAEIRRGFGGDGLGNDRLPWLEPVEDEDDYAESGGGGRLLLWVVVALAAVAMIAAAFVYWNRYRAAHADIGAVIHAPPGPYKEKPANPGGLAVNEGDRIAAKMGTGTDIDSPLDLARIPEQPITGAGREPDADQPASPAPPPQARPTPAPPAARAAAAVPAQVVSAPVAKVPAPPPAAGATAPALVPPAAPAASGGGIIQLGALGSEAKARQVWKTLSTRFGFLAPLTMSITPVKTGDATLFRLRASGGDARRLCAQLKVAGESCNVVG